MKGAIELGAADLALAAGLLLVSGAISVALGLGLERRMVLAAVRTVVQLLAVGHVLAYVFGASTPWLVVGALSVMTVTAARAAVARSSRTFGGAVGRTLVTLLVTGFVSTSVVTQVVIGVEPWYQARYVIPLAGMVFGNGLTGIALCLDLLLETLDARRDQVEARLALGATAWEAARGPVRDAVRRGMIPILNTMSVAGLVSLPGMMTGQILAGADPVQAVAYQIVVMFMIAAATSLGCMLSALFVYQRLFNDRHQLLAHLITKR